MVEELWVAPSPSRKKANHLSGRFGHSKNHPYVVSRRLYDKPNKDTPILGPPQKTPPFFLGGDCALFAGARLTASAPGASPGPRAQRRPGPP